MTKLRTVLKSLDEPALAALSNKGLLRRAMKDLEDAPPEIVEETETTLRLRVGGCDVQLSSTLQDSTCSCPAGSVCRHILTAILYVQQLPCTDPDSAQPPELLATTAKPNVSTPGISEAGEFAEIPEETIRKWAGAALFRRARQEIARGIAAEPMADSPSAFRIPTWGETVWWIPGAGLQGMLCSCHAPSPCIHRVVAILCLCGHTNTSTESCAFLAEPKGATRSRAEVRETLGQLLREILQLGFSRLSASIERRLHTLAVSAHGVDLPRLERMLHAFAHEVGLYLRRDAQASSPALLAIASQLEALRFALERPTESAVGHHRGRYDPVAAMELIGVGARCWRSRSGYAGLTVHFYDTGSRSWISWTDARPVGQSNFDPRSRYVMPGPWAGCRDPKQASRSLIRLSGAWRSRSGRLSGRETTNAHVLGPSPLSESLPVTRSWEDLANLASRTFALGLKDPGESVPIVLIEPYGWSAPRYDPIRQELVIQLTDTQGAVVPLILARRAETQTAISFLESFSPGPDTRILGFLGLYEGQFRIDPFALHQGEEVLNLGLDDEASSCDAAAQAAEPLNAADIDDKDLDEEETDEESAPCSSTRLGQLLNSGQRHLESLAEAGLAAPVNLPALGNIVARLEQLGIASCARRGRLLHESLKCDGLANEAATHAAAGRLLAFYYALKLAGAHDAIQDARSRSATGDRQANFG